MELLRDRFDVLLEKAQGGDKDAQFELAKCLFNGTLAEPSVEQAQYWAFKSALQGNNSAISFYMEHFNKKI